jgi:hypothetical protein
MTSRCIVVFIASCLLMAGVAGQRKQLKNDGRIEVTLLQLNDIYEISPLDHGKIGELRDSQLYAKNWQDRTR